PSDRVAKTADAPARGQHLITKPPRLWTGVQVVDVQSEPHHPASFEGRDFGPWPVGGCVNDCRHERSAHVTMLGLIVDQALIGAEPVCPISILEDMVDVVSHRAIV